MDQFAQQDPFEVIKMREDMLWASQSIR